MLLEAPLLAGGVLTGVVVPKLKLGLVVAGVAVALAEEAG